MARPEFAATDDGNIARGHLSRRARTTLTLNGSFDEFVVQRFILRVYFLEGIASTDEISCVRAVARPIRNVREKITERRVDCVGCEIGHPAGFFGGYFRKIAVW